VESYLVFADSTAANVVNGKGWASLAAKEFAITTQVVALSNDVVEKIKEAQRRQDIRTIDDCDAEPT
jgi:ribosomal protein L19E